MRLVFYVVLAFALQLLPAHADTAVTLRAHIEASGNSVTLGDVFDGAGTAAGRILAPAPLPGQTASIPVPVIAAAATGAGLNWTPPPGVTSVQVVRSAGERAFLPSQASTASPLAPRRLADAAVHRGETVMLTFAVPGVSLTARARALEDGAIGQDIRLVNPSSNRTIDAVVTGPGAATASPNS